MEQNGHVNVIGEGLSPSGDGSTRFQGGAGAITSMLHSYISKHDNIKLLLNHNVVSVNGKTEVTDVGTNFKVQVEAKNASNQQSNVLLSDAVVLSLPPQLILKNIAFEPKLDPKKAAAMRTTATWMQNTGKVAFIYDSCWWRDKSLSGTAFSQSGPLAQVWDNTATNSGKPVYALTGFVFGQDLNYLKDEKTIRNSPIMKQLVNIFGKQAENPTQILFKSWMHDEFTSVGGDNHNITPFGSAQVRARHFNNRIIFSGTETAPNENGHMQGAVVAGERAAREILEVLEQK
jgi:monoamine oxidase